MAYVAVDSIAVDQGSLHANASHEAFWPDQAACNLLVLASGCSPERSPGTMNIARTTSVSRCTWDLPQPGKLQTT